MGEIPGYAWVGIGVFIGIVSLYLGFINKTKYYAFFQLMFVVGIAMTCYGYIFKIKIKERTLQSGMEERRRQTMQQRGETDVEIDIDDYRNNPQLRAEIMRKRSNYNSNTNTTYNGTPRTYSQGHYDRREPSGYPGQAPAQQNIQYQQRQQGQQPQQNFQNTQNDYPGMRLSKNAPGATRYCPSCGTPLLKEHKYCPICGART